MLPSPPPPEPFLHEQDLGNGGERLSNTVANIDTHDQSKATQPAEADDGDPEEEVHSSSSSDSEDEPLPNPELDAILEDMGHSSGSSATEEDETDELARVPVGSKTKRALGRHNGPACNVAMLVLACWHLRMPVIYMDFVRCVTCVKACLECL
jgi:RNA polymerase I-specific transcription initiation factor RRN7